MKLDKNTKLSDLMYGHGDKFMCLLSGQFDSGKHPNAPPIRLCEMKCGCWIVGDGNNRVGLILKNNPDATIADIPKDLLSIEKFGEWDNEMMGWWTPCPRSFKDVMSERAKKTSEPKNSIHGVIERNDEGKFFAIATSIRAGGSPSAFGRTANEAKRLLEEKIRVMLKRENVSLRLTPITPLEDHRCNR